MVKFIVLQNNQRLMPSIGIYARENVTAAKARKIQMFFVYLFLFGQMNVVLQNSWKFFDKSIPFVDKVATLQVRIAFIQSIGVYLSMRLSVEKISSLNMQLQSFVNTEGLHLLSI